MKFVKKVQEKLRLGPAYRPAIITSYTTEDGIVYTQMGLAWFDVNGKRLIGDISHLSKAADDLNERETTE